MIVPFVIANGGEIESLMRNNQVRFMIDVLHWLKAEHVLDWDKIKELRTLNTQPTSGRH